MKKIGIVTCARSNDVCARVSCLAAFNERRDYFGDYGKDAILSALMTCNGCTRDTETPPEQTPGMIEKVERLRMEGISVMHAGACRLHKGKECPRMTQIISMLEKNGIRVIRGTHRESSEKE